MSDFWGTRHRLLMRQYEKLVDQLSGTEAPGEVPVEEQAVRLLTGAVLVLRQHTPSKRGRCWACAAPGRFWRLWLRRSPCAVYRDLSFAMSQRIDVVWWRLLESTGRSASLEQVRQWLPEWERLTACRRRHETLQDQGEPSTDRSIAHKSNKRPHDRPWD